MTVKVEDLTPGTVAVSKDGRIAIVTAIKPSNTKYPIIYTFKTDARGYKGNAGDFRAILGSVDLDVWNDSKPEAPKSTAVGFEDCLGLPPVLKGLKIGDMITIRSRKGTQQAEYQGYNPRRPKNCVSIRMNGKEYKGPLSIVVQAAPSASA